MNFSSQIQKFMKTHKVEAALEHGYQPIKISTTTMRDDVAASI